MRALPPRAGGVRGSSWAAVAWTSRRRATRPRRTLRQWPRPRAARATRRGGAALAPYTESLGSYRPIPVLQSALMIYCVIPRELAEELYDKMVEYYKDNPNVTV